MSTTVRILWTWSGPNFELWNHVATRAIEQFGLPGDRYICRADTNHINFVFEDNKDALMFALEHGGNIISNQQQTVEFVSKLL